MDSHVLLAACMVYQFTKHKKARLKDGMTGNIGIFTDLLVQALHSHCWMKEMTYADLVHYFNRMPHQMPVVAGYCKGECIWYQQWSQQVSLSQHQSLTFNHWPKTHHHLSILYSWYLSVHSIHYKENYNCLITRLLPPICPMVSHDQESMFSSWQDRQLDCDKSMHHWTPDTFSARDTRQRH